MKALTTLFAFFAAALIAGCTGPSLEKYYVENQENDNFIVMNIPADILVNDTANLSEKQRATFEKIEKANILAFPLNKENKAVFEKEKEKVEQILAGEEYKLLMKFGTSGNEFQVLYKGENSSIDEMIVYGTSDSAGFGVARILGNDMKTKDMAQLVKTIKNGEGLVNTEGMKQIQDMFEKEISEKK